MTEAADLSTHAFTALADLASARVGGRAIATNDDFFAPMSNLVKRRAADLHSRQVHRSRQVDGRLGVAPPPHARSRLVRRRARHPRRHSRRERGHAATSPATSRRTARSTRSTRRGRPRQSMGECGRRTRGAPWIAILEKTALARQQRQPDSCQRSAAVDARAAEHLSRRRRGAPARLR